MPYVLKNKATSEIFSCTLINFYKIPYHGAMYWDTYEEAKAEAPSFLLQRELEADDWELLEAEEHRLKVFNVKLANDPARKLFLDADGRPVSRSIS